MCFSPLDQILARRAEIARKLVSYEALKKEDAELEVAQRVLERMTHVNGSTNIAAPGAETQIVNILANRGGSIKFDELIQALPDVQLNSLRSIISRMKRKGLVERDGDIVFSPKQPTSLAKKNEGPAGPSDGGETPSDLDEPVQITPERESPGGGT